ncbi:MAG: tetratricopeptide repeat protein [Candidatus Cloacimonetes bacterium]|nr:tetratricopeptide repeat protein [Candidatus Cloacimonadota bacterium]
MRKIVILFLLSLLLGACTSNLSNMKQWEQVEQALLQNRLQLEQLRTDLIDAQETAQQNYLQKIEGLELTIQNIQEEQSRQKEATQQEFAELREAAKAGAEPSAQLSQAQEDIQELSRAFDQQNTSMDQKLTALEREVRELRLAMAEDSAVGSQKVEKTTTSTAAPPPPPAVDDGMDPVRRVYESARAEYVGGQFQRAISKFIQFVKDHPESEFCGNAYYWKGESYFAMSEWRQALKEFQTVVTEYPNSWKEIDAQLKTGMCYIKLNEHTKARAALNIIRRNFPQYERMDLVNHYLNQLD